MSQKHKMKILCKTWNKEAYELIDYDSVKLVYNEYEIEKSGFLYRNQNNVEYSEIEKKSNPDNLLQIIKTDTNYMLKLNEYEIDEDENIITPNSTWFLLRKELMDERMNEYNLNQGDILKIGRITLKIRMIKFTKKKEKSINTDISQDLEEMEVKPLQVEEKAENLQNKLCRICYIEEETPDNPLIQPCICSGSMKYIHLDCLKHWLDTSVYIKVEDKENCQIYLYKEAQCELCKTKFPDFIRHKGRLYEILDFSKTFNNYILIESITLDKNQNKFIYVINLDIQGKKLNIGRGHDCHVLLNDISVSRLHCFLNIDQGARKVYFSDNNSKFGTLILVQTKNLILSTDLKLFLQIGRTFFELLQYKSMNIFGCCGISEKKNSDFYFSQNSEKHNRFLRKFTVKTEIDFSEKYNEKKDKKKNDEEKTLININDIGELIDDIEENIKPTVENNKNEELIKEESIVIQESNQIDNGDKGNQEEKKDK